MTEQELLEKTSGLFAQESRLIALSPPGRAVFVGDTHGDLEASQIVVQRYLNDETALVFLGDYVDRGPHSLENILYLLRLKLQHPERVFLLQGNHEGWKFREFSPADFWKNLSEECRARLAETLALLPWAVATSNGIIATHGALPDVQSLQEIKEIEPGSENWRALIWGDWHEVAGYYLGDQGSRPQFGEAYFREIMRRLDKKILIRGHQPHVPRYLFGQRCLTIFTSSAYPVPRTVAIADLAQELHKADQLAIAAL